MEPLSGDAVRDIAGVLLEILKRLRTSHRRIIQKEKTQCELTVCPLWPVGSLTSCWQNVDLFYLPFKKIGLTRICLTGPMLNIKV